MKAVKTALLIFTFLIVGVTNVTGQKPDFANIVTENLVESLDHDIEGVVEASIYNTIFLQKYYPEADINRVIDKLNDLAEDTENPSIRYKANMAAMYLKYYDTSEIDLENYKLNREKLFRKISDELDNKLLASSQ